MAAIVIGLLGGVVLGVFLFGGRQPLIVQLMCLVVLTMAVLFEVKGGLAAALVMSFLLFFPTLVFPTLASTASSGVAAWSQSALFLLVGGAVGWSAKAFRRRVVETESAVDHLSDICVSLLSNLALIVEGRDKGSRGHCNRVAHNARAMGEVLGFNSKQLETLHWGALLHDLGKIAVSEAILLKPGALTEEEFGEIKRHSAYGAELLEAVSEEFEEIARVVRAHHERWDGLGYPLGLGRDAIPLMSRIVAVADVFEALTSERPYRKPLHPAQALLYLKAEAGSHFDPDIVALFEELLKQNRVQIAEVHNAETPIKDDRVATRTPNLRATLVPSEMGLSQSS